MNPLTLVKRTQQINLKEAALGISEQASWHARYNDSAYVFVGGVPFELTEGDLLAVFAQYGEIVDVNLVKDKGTGKSKGFAFVAYEDQRSTSLAVDNLNGAQVLGRTIRVDHCSKYKKKEEEDEETRRQKREERGVCRAFQKGQCDRGDSCRFSHDEKRAANTGWGAEEDRQSQSRWANDKFDDPRKNGHSGQSGRNMKDDRSSNQNLIESRRKDEGVPRDRRQEGSEWKSRDQGSRGIEKRAENGKGRNYEDELDRPHANRKSRRPDDEDSDIRDGKKLRRSDSESLQREEQERKEGHRRQAYAKDSFPRSRMMDDDDDDEQREDRANKRDEKRTTRYESDSYQREEREPRGGVKRSDYDRDSSPRLRRTDEDRGRRSHR